MDFFDAAIIKIFFDFIKKNGGQAMNATPFEVAMANNRQYGNVR